MNLFGDIYPCVYTHISLGNIRQSSLRDIRANGLRVPEYAAYAAKCLSGEDRDFIKRYISKGFGRHKPTDGSKIFGLGPPPERV
jgi:MoaA/NifB/PqqE/SkfB family radical SAM enzyme